MQTALIYGITAAKPTHRFARLSRVARKSGVLVGLTIAGAALAACVEQQPTTAAPQQAAAPSLPPILPFDQAVANAANAVFTSAPQGSYRVVIDPLVDGVTGYTSS